MLYQKSKENKIMAQTVIKFCPNCSCGVSSTPWGTHCSICSALLKSIKPKEEEKS